MTDLQARHGASPFGILALLAVVVVAVFLFWNPGGGNSPAAAERCLPVPSSMAQVLADSLTVQGGGSISATAAVRSEDFDNIYFISAEIDGPGMEGTGDVGVWSSNRLEGGQGMIFAVNGIANEFSVFPSGPDSSANITMSDDGAQEAASCLGR